jgi:hypothetical protein
VLLSVGDWNGLKSKEVEVMPMSTRALRSKVVDRFTTPLTPRSGSDEMLKPVLHPEGISATLTSALTEV